MELVSPIADDYRYMKLAIAEAEAGAREGGVPVGCVMVRADAVIGAGHNRSRQHNDPTSHAEIECIRNGGLRNSYSGVTLYTTVSPCMMCTGAMLFIRIPRVVIGDRRSFAGDIPFLLSKGLLVSVLDDENCYRLMVEFAERNPEFWTNVASGGSGPMVR